MKRTSHPAQTPVDQPDEKLVPGQGKSVRGDGKGGREGQAAGEGLKAAAEGAGIGDGLGDAVDDMADAAAGADMDADAEPDSDAGADADADTDTEADAADADAAIDEEEAATGSIEEFRSLLATELATDATQRYLNHIGQRPLLTPEQEQHYATLAKQGDFSARQVMIEHNLRLVVSIAKHYVNRGVVLLDLIEEGNLGLMHSIGKFEP